MQSQQWPQATPWGFWSRAGPSEVPTLQRGRADTLTWVHSFGESFARVLGNNISKAQCEAGTDNKGQIKVSSPQTQKGFIEWVLPGAQP